MSAHTSPGGGTHRGGHTHTSQTSACVCMCAHLNGDVDWAVMYRNGAMHLRMCGGLGWGAGHYVVGAAVSDALWRRLQWYVIMATEVQVRSEQGMC